jgi:hypothetical protein
LVDVIAPVLELPFVDHLVESLGVEDDRVVEVRREDGDVDGEVEEGEADLVEVERRELVVLADFLRELGRVDSAAKMRKNAEKCGKMRKMRENAENAEKCGKMRKNAENLYFFWGGENFPFYEIRTHELLFGWQI